jgi:hypothetical protein
MPVQAALGEFDPQTRAAHRHTTQMVLDLLPQRPALFAGFLAALFDLASARKNLADDHKTVDR